MSLMTERRFDALHRLVTNRPNIVPKNTPITLDAVALEAGYKKGAIRRARESNTILIESIDAAASEQANKRSNTKSDKVLIEKVRSKHREVLKFKALYEESLAREISLIKQLWEERAEWAKLNQSMTGEKIVSFYERFSKS